MDTETLVERQIDDGRRLTDLLVQKGVDVTAAFWVKTSEDDIWFLYIATEAVDKKGLAAAYRDVYGVLRSIEGICISTSDIKLIGKNNPITLDILRLSQQNPAGTPTRYRRSYSIGAIAIEELFIYPTPETYFEGFAAIKSNFPSAEHFTITVPRTGTDPMSLFKFISPYIDKVNKQEFEGKAPGTLLFLGLKASTKAPWAKLGFVYRPEGWNKMFRADKNTWEEVVDRATRKPLYESLDFSPLADLKTTALRS
jgi:hypothetical protein